MNREYNELYYSFLHPETDPVSDLEEYIETQEQELHKYASKPNHVADYLLKLIRKHNNLVQIFKKFKALRYYWQWVEVEQFIERTVRSGVQVDGATVYIHFVNNPDSERMIRYELKSAPSEK